MHYTTLSLIVEMLRFAISRSYRSSRWGGLLSSTSLFHGTSLRFQSDIVNMTTGRDGVSSPSGGDLIGGLSARSVAVESVQMKKKHLETKETALAHQARRLLLASSLDVGPQIAAKEVSDILTSSVYFGLGHDAPIVRQCVEWIQKYERELPPECMGPVVNACHIIGGHISKEIINSISIRAMRNARYLDPKSLTQLIVAFAKADLLKDKLITYLTRRFYTLGMVGEFSCRQLVLIVQALAQAQYHNEHIRKVIQKKIYHMKDSFTVQEILSLTVSFVKLRIHDERTVRRLAAKSVDLAEQMTSQNVCTLFQAFALFGVKYDQLFGVLTNRAVELMDEFSAKHIVVTLKSFMNISISNPELFDNLAERAMSIMEKFEPVDVVMMLESLHHFKITDEELLKRLAEQCIVKMDEFEFDETIKTLNWFSRMQYSHPEYMEAFGVYLMYRLQNRHMLPKNHFEVPENLRIAEPMIVTDLREVLRSLANLKCDNRLLLTGIEQMLFSNKEYAYCFIRDRLVLRDILRGIPRDLLPRTVRYITHRENLIHLHKGSRRAGRTGTLGKGKRYLARQKWWNEEGRTQEERDEYNRRRKMVCTNCHRRGHTVDECKMGERCPRCDQFGHKVETCTTAVNKLPFQKRRLEQQKERKARYKEERKARKKQKRAQAREAAAGAAAAALQTPEPDEMEEEVKSGTPQPSQTPPEDNPEEGEEEGSSETP